MMAICSEIKRVCIFYSRFATVFRVRLYSIGNESYAIVEFSPYQKVPSEKKKPDARNATIEQGIFDAACKFSVLPIYALDEDYVSFLNALNAPATTEPVSMESLGILNIFRSSGIQLNSSVQSPQFNTFQHRKPRHFSKP
jgi:hypothetical protein